MPIYNIRQSLSFVDTLAKGVLERYESEEMSQLVILLPNRRSCRHLQESFLNQVEGRALIPPLMRGIGDTDEAELIISGSDNYSLYQEIPPAISPIKRRLILSDLIQEQNNHLTKAQSARLAYDLACFIDDTLWQDLSLDDLASLVPGELAEHWQITLNFFDFIGTRWPSILKELGKIDAVERSKQLIRLQAKIWQETPPSFPVIVAGTTASVPATMDLLKVVNALDNSSIILPGLDIEMAEDAWKNLQLKDKNNDAKCESHPQFGLKKLLFELGFKRQDIEDWGDYGLQKTPELREKLVSTMMVPPENCHTWRDANIQAEHLEGITKIEAEHHQQESNIISMIMRDVLETKDKTAALVTNDRDLAMRVTSNLKKWKIDIDDSSGGSLQDTSPAIFLQLVLDVVTSGFSHVELLAALKHPCFANGKYADSKSMELFEHHILREAKGNSSPDELIKNLDDTKLSDDDKDGIVKWFQNLKDGLSGLSSVIQSGKETNLNKLISCHIRTAEELSSDNDNNFAIWAGYEGEDLSTFLRQVLEAVDHDQIIEAQDYSGIYESFFLGTHSHPRFRKHPRLVILSPMEARLKHFDIMILGSLNDGSWPSDTVSPWMSKPMKIDFGLPTSARVTGMAAHEFSNFMCAPEVILTRAQKVNGTPMVESSWLLRLDAVVNSSKISQALEPEKPWHEWCDIVDQPDSEETYVSPYPTPPLQARPKRLSVTGIEKLIRDPYSIYARYILDLKALSELGQEPGVAEFGSAIHDILDRFVKKTEPCSLNSLLASGEEVFAELPYSPVIKHVWWNRFLSISNWFIGFEKERRQKATEIKTEIKGEMELEGFTISAKADRIEIQNDGDIAIIDYKTGTIPTKKDVNTGLSPQLTLEALIAQDGGFDLPKNSRTGELSYIKLATNVADSKKYSVFINVADGELVKQAQDGVTSLIQHFQDEKSAYISCPNLDYSPKYNDYEHLARVKEWLLKEGSG